MAKLFISYSRKDKDAARRIIEELIKMGHDIWVDWEDIPPASDWLEQIYRGIEGVDAFLFMISPFSVASVVCTQEVRHAEKNNKRIIPIALTKLDPKETIDTIRKRNWIFMREEDDQQLGLSNINKAINLDFDWVAEHSRLQTRALDWERKKEPALLLRGTDLWQARQSLKSAEEKRKEPEPSPLQKTFLEFSNRNEQRNLIISAIAILVMLVLAGLAYAAITQRNLARDNEKIANDQRALAEKNATIAAENAIKADKNAQRAEDNARNANRQKQVAEKARDAAEKSRSVAAAQRSAARAQIYQFRTGELYTSTLLAIDSQLTQPSKEAEELLRENISLLPPPIGQVSFPGQITSVNFHPRGDIYITAADNGSVCGWQVTDNQKLFCFDSPGPVTSAVFTPTGDRVLAGDKLGNLQIINTDDGTLQKTLTFEEKAITDITVQPNGRYAAVTTEDAKVTLVDLGKLAISPFDFSGISIRFARFSPNNAQIATGSQNGFVDIWTLASSGAPLTKPIHRDAILALAYSPNGRFLVTGSADGTAVILDAKTLEKRSILQHDDQVKDIAFNKNGDWFVTVSNDRKIRMWKTDTGRLLLVMSQDDFVQNVEVSDNDLWIATTGDDRTVRIWSAITGTQLYQMPLKGKGSTLAFNRNGTNLVAGDLNGYVRNWDLTAIPTPISSLRFEGVTASAAFSPSGTWIAASADRNVWLLKPLTLSPQTTTPPGSPYGESQTIVNQLVFSPNEKWMAVLNNGNQIVVYKPEQKGGTPIRPTDPVQTFAFTSDEASLLVGSTTGTLQLWSITSRQGSNLQSFDARITALATRGDLVAVGLNEQLRLFRLDGTQLVELPLPQSVATIDLLAFSLDGTLLASGSTSGNIQIWKRDNDTFKFLESITRENVASLAFSPDNRYLAIGALDSIFVINTTTLKENFRLPQTGTVTSLSFSPNGQTLLTASLKVLQFWDFARLLQNPITPENIVPTACSLPFEDLTSDQKTELLVNESKVLCDNLKAPY